jgi:hypothetical protein
MRKRKLPLALAAAVSLFAAATAVGATFTDVQANNPQVAGDPSSNTTAKFPTNKQNEPSIAVNPTNARFLVAGANDEQRQPPCGPGPVRGSGAPANDCSFFPGVGGSGVYTSSDGGSTWTNRGLLPGYSEFPGEPGTLVSDGDPRLAYGPSPGADGNFANERAKDKFVNGTRVYYASLASFAAGAAQGNQQPELLGVSTSDDNGVRWDGPFVGAEGSGFRFNDHEDITADDNPSSAFFGRVYLSWTQFRGSIFTFCAEPIIVAFSDDGGRTWSNPNQLSEAHNCGIGGRQSSTVRTGPDGSVYVVWLDTDNKLGDVQVIAASHDGGVTFSHPMTIAQYKPIADPIPGANFRDGSDPSLAVDQVSGAVYAAFSDAASGSGRIVVYKSTDGGRTWSRKFTSSAADGYAFFQGLDVAPSGRIDLGYQAQKAVNPSTYGTGNASIDSYYVSSSNGGTTWTASTKVSSASSDPAASAQNNLQRQFWGDYNTLVSSNANAWFIYTDSRNGVGCAAVDAYQHSVDGSGPSAPKPAPQNSCGSQFGNSDVFVSKITP